MSVRSNQLEAHIDNTSHRLETKMERLQDKSDFIYDRLEMTRTEGDRIEKFSECALEDKPKI